MTANAPCTFSARSMFAAGDSDAASSASSHLVDVAQLHGVAATSTRNRQRRETRDRPRHAGAGIEPVDVNGGREPERASLPRPAARRAVAAQRQAI